MGRIGIGIGIPFSKNSTSIPWTVDFDAPPNIATDYTAAVAWKNKRQAQFESKCPSARATTYYFSQSDGDDSTGDGSQENPWQTISKAQTEINNSSGDLRLRFKRGDVWRETTGLNVNKDNITVDDYGTGDKPFFNRFQLYPTSGWVLASGIYALASQPTPVAWVRRTNDNLSALIKVSSLAECQSTPNSWFESGGSVVVNLDGDNPNTVQLEYVLSNTNDGILADGDGIRIENIRGDGWGMSTTDGATQRHPMRVSQAPDEAVLVKGCESYYNTSHGIAHLQPGGSGNGGITMFLNCKSGYTSFNGSAGETVFNTYSDDGGHETWFIDCECTYGTLPSDDWSYDTLKARGTAFFNHTALNGITGLAVVWNCTRKATEYAASTLASLNDLPDSSGVITAARGFIVNSTHEKPTEGKSDRMSFNDDCVQYANKLFFRPNDTVFGALWASRPSNLWIINSQIEFDAQSLGNVAFGLYNGSAGVADIQWWHTDISVINSNVWTNSVLQRWAIDRDEVFSSGAPPGTTSTDCVWINGVYSIDDGAEATVSFGQENAAENIINTAFYGDNNGANQIRGRDNGTNNINLSAHFNIGDEVNALKEAGSTDIVLSHDINGKRRTVSTPDVGSVDYSS